MTEVAPETASAEYEALRVTNRPRSTPKSACGWMTVSPPLPPSRVSANSEVETSARSSANAGVAARKEMLIVLRAIGRSRRWAQSQEIEGRATRRAEG